MKKKAPEATTQETEVEVIDGQPMQKEFLDIEYNNRTRQSYFDNGFTPPDNLDNAIRKFMSRVDTSGKFPVKKVVTRLLRTKWRNPDTKKEGEYLVVFSNYFGKDFMGRRVSPVVDIIDGMYYRVETEPDIEYSPPGPIRKGNKMIGTTKMYYTPFSKEAVDEIIEKADDTYKDEIRYCIKFDTTLRDERFNYDQFLKPWDECWKLSSRKGGPQYGSQYAGGEDVLKAGVT